MDALEKITILKLDSDNLPTQETFPLEPVSVFAGEEKITSNTAPVLRFWTHKQLARTTYYALQVLPDRQFDKVDWLSVYDGLHSVPRVFVVWASNQVMGIAPTNQN